MSTTRTALARLYRPRRFAEMATQEHVWETLRAAVARGRVAHAYLFAGPRGVGKTTAARVLAMALNCPDRTPEGEPCGVCDSCDRIWSGKTSLDVVEIDAASNRGVDDARDLRERAMYAPTDEHRFKVYIIDEAHMLTREAWNALLKILEEPPPRVIFVLATTEPQKIQQAAPPILSRCQRFDFRRLSVQAIVERLKLVLASEGHEIGDDALVTIARRAEGGMRDALSLLDQVLSFADKSLSAADVRRVLGITGEELYLDLFEILAERRHGDVFRFVQRLVDEGHDLAEFYRGLADALRALLVAKLEGPGEADVRDDLRPAFAAMAARFATGDLLRMLAQVAELDTDGRFRKSASPRLLLEALLLRFAHLDRTIELEQVIRAAGGVADAVGPGAPGESGGEPPPAPGGRGPGAGAPSGAGPSTAEPVADVPARRPRKRGQSGPPPVEWGDVGAEPESASAVGPPPAAEARSPRTDPAPASRARAAAPPAATADPAPAAEADSAPAAPAGPASAIEAALRSLAAAGRLPAGTGPVLRAAQVLEAGPERIVLELPSGYALERLSDTATLRAVEDALALQLGTRRPVVVQELRRAGDRGESSGRLTPERVKAEKVTRMSRDEPLLGRAVEEWNLELLD